MTQNNNQNKQRGACGFAPALHQLRGANKARGALAKPLIRWLSVFCLLWLALGAAGDSARGVAVDDLENPHNPDGFRYSQWLHTPNKTPQHNVANSFVGNSGHSGFWHSLGERVGESAFLALRDLPPTGKDVNDSLLRFVRGGDINPGQWRRARFVRVLEEFDSGASQAVASALEDEFGSLSFVRHIGVDWQSSFGSRNGHLAVRALGGWHLSPNEVAGWQARFYSNGGNKAEGGSLGLFARAAQDDKLFGVNIFADYQREDEGGFWRGSLGGQWRSRYGAAFVNRYWQLGGTQQLSGGTVAYSREGVDARLLVHLPKMEWISLSGDYYHWRGRYGDNDERGFRYGLRFRPGGGWNAGVRYGNGKWDADISYQKILGEESLSARNVADVDARIYFWNAVRREYGQRISRVAIAQEKNTKEEKNKEIVNAKSADALVIAGEAGLRFRVSSPGALMTISDFGSVLSVYQNAPPTARAAGTLLLTMAPRMALASDSGGGSVILRGRNADWRLFVAQESHLVFGGVSQVSVMDGGGAFHRGTAGRSPSLFALSSSIAFLTIGVDDSGARFGFRVSGRAFITLSEGALSVWLPSSHTAALTADIGPQNASLRIFGATLAVVGCGAITMLWHLRAHCAASDTSEPEPISIEVVFGNTIIAVGRWQGVAKVSAAGGYVIEGGDYRYSAAADSALAAIGISGNGEISISVVNAGMITATITADDNHLNTPPATLLITIKAIDSLVLEVNKTQATITSHIASTIALATLQAAGGLPGYNYSLISNVGGVSLSGGIVVVSLSVSALFATMTSALTATAIVSDSADSAVSVVITLSVEVINPPSLSLSGDLVNSLVNVGRWQEVAKVSAAGGYVIEGGDYRYSAAADSALAAIGISSNGEVSISVVNAGMITATITADDNHLNTPPATLLITIKAVDSLVLEVNKTQATITSHIANTIALATLQAAGGLPEYNYSLISEVGGVSLSGGIVVVSLSVSAPSATITSALTATAIVSDLADSAVSVVITLSVEVINPPSLSLSGDLVNSLLVVGRWQGVAKVSAAGGYVIEGGDYRYSAVADSALAAIGISGNGEVSISVVNVGMITATITADDNHLNTPPATLLITIKAVDSLVLEVNKTQATITSHIANTIALATLQAAGGLPEYNYSLISDIGGVSLSGGIVVVSLSVSAPFATMTSALTATAIVSDAADSAVSVVITLSVQVVNPPSLSLSGDLVNSLIVVGRWQGVAKVSAAGGYVIEGGDYRYSATADSALAAIGISGNGEISISVVNAGMITATITADDNHLNTPPATLLITIKAVDSLVLEVNKTQATITSHIANTIALATLQAAGGLPGYNYSLISEVGGVSLSGGIVVVSLSVSLSLATITSALTATAIVSDSADSAVSVVITLSVEVVNPPSLSLSGDLGNSLVVVGRWQGVAKVSAAGGYVIDGGDYRYSAAADSALAAVGISGNGAVSISVVNVGMITATITADDNHPNTLPSTILITARATADLILDIAVASVTLKFYADADATLATLRARGGLAAARLYTLTGGDDGISLRGSVVVLSASVGASSVYAFSAAVMEELPGVGSLSASASAVITAAMVGFLPITVAVVRVAPATAVLHGRRQFIASLSISGGDLTSGQRYGMSIFHAAKSGIAPRGFSLNAADALLPVVSSDDDILWAAPSRTHYRRGFITLTLMADDDNADTAAAMASLTATVLATMLADSSGIKNILLAGRTGFLGTALFYDAQGTLSVSVSPGFSVSVVPLGGLSLSGARMYYPFTAAADAPDGWFGIYATLRATGTAITGTIVGDYAHGPRIEATALFTVSIRGLFGVAADDGATITTYLTGAIATLRAYNTGASSRISLLGDAGGVSLSANALFFMVTIDGAHSITITAAAEDESSPQQRATTVMTISFYAADPPPIVISRQAGNRFTIVLRNVRVSTDIDISITGGYRNADNIYDLSAGYESPLITIQGTPVTAINLSLADNGFLYTRSRGAVAVPITVYADDNHPRTGRGSLVLTVVYEQGIGAFVSDGGYSPSYFHAAGLNRITVRAGYPFEEEKYWRNTDHNRILGGGKIIGLHFQGFFGRPDYTLTAPDVVVRQGRFFTNRPYINATVAQSDGPFLADRQVAEHDFLQLDLVYVDLRLRTATAAAEMTATLIMSDAKDSGYIPATVIVEVTVNRKLSISASLPSGTVVQRIAAAATLAMLGGESDDMPIIYRPADGSLPGLRFDGGALRYDIGTIGVITVTVIGEDSYSYIGKSVFSVHSQTAALTLTATVALDLIVSVDTLATVFNPGFAGTVGTFVLSRGHLEAGGGYSHSFNGAAGFRVENNTIFFQSDDKGLHIATIIADDDFGGTSPVSVLITVLVADCRYFAPYCPALNHRAEQSDGDSIFEGAQAQVQSLLRAGVDANETNARGATPLTRFRNAAVISVFVQAGASVNVRDEEGCSPLYYASAFGSLYKGKYSGQYAAMRILLSMAVAGGNADPNAEVCNEGYGIRPLHAAYYSADAARLLLDAGARINATTTANRHWEGITLHARSTFLDITRRIASIHPRLMDSPAWDAYQVGVARGGFCNAFCKYGLINIISRGANNKLLNVGIKKPVGTLALLGKTITVGVARADRGGVDTQTISLSPNPAFTLSPDARTLIFVGDGSAGKKIVTMRIEDTSSDITGRNYSLTVLVVGEGCGYFAPNNCGAFSNIYGGDNAQGTNNPAPPIMRQLLNAGIDPNERESFSQRTPLHVAVLSATLAKMLLEAGADVDAQDMEGRTPLHMHTRRIALGEYKATGTRDMPQRFIHILTRQHNADVSIADYYGETPLHLVVNDGSMAHELIRLGASVNATISFIAPLYEISRLVGDTPLDNANRYADMALFGRLAATAAIAIAGGRCNNACLPGNTRLDGVKISAPPPPQVRSTVIIVGGADRHMPNTALTHYRLLLAQVRGSSNYDGSLHFTTPSRLPPALELVGHRGALLNGTVYIAGGGTATGKFNGAVSHATYPIHKWKTYNNRFDAVRDHELVAHDNELILAGGVGKNSITDAVWASSDGITWTRRGSLPVPLSHFAMASYNGAIYADGGITQNNNFSRATYRSMDGGRTWRSLVGVGGLPGLRAARYNHRLVVHRGMLHMVGGTTNGNTRKKILRSIDGKHWLACADSITQAFPDDYDGDFDAFSIGGRLFLIGAGVGKAPSITDCTDTKSTPWISNVYGFPARSKVRTIVIP